MAKKGYPGLVLVPPSDRQILRRRITHSSVLIFTLVSGLSAVNIWLPSSDSSTGCQTDAGLAVTPEPQEECHQLNQPAPEPSSHQNTPPVVTKSAQAAHSAAAPDTRSATAPRARRAQAKETADQTSTITHKAAPSPSSTRSGTPSPESKSTASQASKNPAPPPTPDTLLAQRGDAFAQYRLGRFYAQHSGPHTQEAITWYRKASDGLQLLAQAGNGEAMYVLGVMYAFGRGVMKDHDQARLWLAQAVEHQVAAARPVLASLQKHRTAQVERTTHGGSLFF